MKRKIVWLVVSCLMVLALLAASCTKAEAPATKETTPATKETTPATKETTPAAKEAAPAVAETPKYGGALIYGRNTGILNWDETYQPTWTLASNLVLVNEELTIGDWAQGPAGTNEFDFAGSGYYTVPSGETGLLAESWELPDDTTIIWHLRKGIHWALDPNNAASRLVGGRELIANDVVFNIRRQYFDNPGTTMYSTAGAARPLDVSAPDKYTVVVKAPKGLIGMTWEYITETCRVMAPEVAQKYGDYQKWENSVGTGPFILKDYVPMSSATWERNPSYWGTDPVGPGKGNQLPYVDSVKQLIIPNIATRLAALRTGKVDYDSGGYTAADAKQLLQSSPQLKYVKDMGGYPIIAMRLDKAGLPWAPQDDPNALKVRRALNLATNNQEIKDVVYGGEGEILSYKIVPHKIFKNVYTPLDQLPTESRELFEYHPDKAKQLLTEAGYPTGFKANMVVRSSNAVALDVSQLLKNYWGKVGIDLEIKPMDDSAMQAFQLKHTHDQMYYHGRSSFNPHVMYSSLTGGMYNMSIVSDPKLDNYYEKMAGAYFDRVKRDALMKEMNLYVLPLAHYVYIPLPYYYYFWQPWMKNYHGERSVGNMNTGGEMKWVWIDQEMRKSLTGR
ncbi:MAG: ABC transporter substrate-binding protein [Chloroflexi bacterium]|nr:ABC transporter substrate-binding protein [Chloroflexota bacterium]